jgi:hypothetical protein
VARHDLGVGSQPARLCVARGIVPSIHRSFRADFDGTNFEVNVTRFDATSPIQWLHALRL